jgi:hypothetical protein
MLFHYQPTSFSPERCIRHFDRFGVVLSTMGYGWRLSTAAAFAKT